jgi:hypothetical protein
MHINVTSYMVNCESSNLMYRSSILIYLICESSRWPYDLIALTALLCDRCISYGFSENICWVLTLGNGTY